MDWLGELVGRVDPAEVVEPGQIPAFRQGWYPPAAHGALPSVSCALRPSRTQTVQEIIRFASARGLAVRAVGGGTSPGGRPEADVLLDLSGLDSVEIRESELTVVCGAGASLETVESALADNDLTHGHRLASARLATVGGAVATDAVGAFSGRYGRFRDSVVALEWVGADGELHTGRVGQSGSLASLHFGSQGRLGIVTQVALRVFPQPEARAWALFDFPDRSAAIESLRLLQRTDSVPALARLVDSKRLVLGFEGDELVQEGMFRLAFAVCQRAGGEAVGSTDDGETWWEKRERVDAWSGNARPGIWADCRAGWARWDRLEDVWDSLLSALGTTVETPRIEVCHPSSNGAALEVRYAWETNEAGWRAGNQRLVSAVRSAGGVPGLYLAGIEDGIFLAPGGRPDTDTVCEVLDPTGIFRPRGPR